MPCIAKEKLQQIGYFDKPRHNNDRHQKCSDYKPACKDHSTMLLNYGINKNGMRILTKVLTADVGGIRNMTSKKKEHTNAYSNSSASSESSIGGDD